MFWGMIASFLLVSVFAFHNWKRSRILEVKELIPNRLLTTHPLVFLSGQRSFFYFLAYWNGLPHWLASHGYEVFHLNLPWRNKIKREMRLREFLQKTEARQEKIHLLIDSSAYSEIAGLLETDSFQSLASVTLIRNSGSMTAPSEGRRPKLTSLRVPIEELELSLNSADSPLFWKLHLLWTGQGLKTSLSCLGWKFSNNPQEPLAQSILDRTQFLAERDLIQRQSSPNLEG